MRPEISIDVYRDIDLPREAIDTVFLGLEPIREHVPALKVSLASRAIRFTNAKDGVIDIVNFRWPRFNAYINVVLTDKTLFDRNHPDNDLMGYHEFRAYSPDGQFNGQLAVVDHDPNTTTHEVGHAFGLKHSGNRDSNNHCTINSCYMYRVAKYMQPHTPTHLQRFAQAVGVRQSPRFESRAYEQYSFCPECATQLGRHAHYLQIALNGGPVDSVMLWGED